MNRCIPVRKNGGVFLVNCVDSHIGNVICIALVDLELALRSQEFTLIYMFRNIERVYRKGDVIIVLNYADCMVETNMSCEYISEILKKFSRDRSILHI